MDESERPFETLPVEERFYQGRILRLSSGKQTGVVRSVNGRDIPFIFAFVVMLGDKTRFEDLHVGTAVGYDVSWTSHGLRVSMMRVVD